MKLFFQFTIILLFTTSSFLELLAQNWIGGGADNFAGIQRMQIQPASIANSPYRIDINVLGVDFEGFNAAFFDNFGYVTNLSDREEERLRDIFEEGKEEYFIHGNVMLPSVAFRLNNKSSLAFAINARANLFTKGSDAEIIDLFLNDFELENLYGREFTGAFLTSRYTGWTEYVINYARKDVWKEGRHSISVGVSPKLIFGQSSGYLGINDLAFQLANEDTLTNLQGMLQFGYTPSLDDIIDGEKFELFGNASLGLNLGVEYFLKRKDTNRDSSKSNVYPDYKLKLGLSLIDLGAIHFDKAANSNDYEVNATNFVINSIRDLDSVEELADSLASNFNRIATDDEYTTQLPTTLNFQLDYLIRDHLYVNVAAGFAINGTARNVFHVRNLNTYNLGIRYEKKWWGIGLPAIYNSVISFNVGTHLRAGPLLVGSSNLISELIKNDAGYANLYLALKIPFYKK